MYRLGIDVGGTNTDAVLVDGDMQVLAEVKTPTTADVYGGVFASVQDVLERSGIDRSQITHAILGTTQCTNAIVERRNLEPVAVLRIGAPASIGFEPLLGWPEDLKFIARASQIIGGGFEHDGREIAPLDIKAATAFFESAKNEVSAVAISCVFSTVQDAHEQEVARIAREVLGNSIPVSISSEIGSMGLIERENATILNAALHKVVQNFTDGFTNSLKQLGVESARLFLTQNDGTVMDIDLVRKYPIKTVACGPTNSIRGAGYLSQTRDAIVIDIGGTTTDIGTIKNGFPRESNTTALVGGVRTNFRMPDILSIGLGGGSIVREDAEGIHIGPDSVGYEITQKARVFGGDILTATDIAVYMGLANVGDRSLVADLDVRFAREAQKKIVDTIEESVDSIKTSQDDIDVIVVGGGSILLPDRLKGASAVRKPPHFAVANALGSAISKVGGTFDHLVSFANRAREEVLAQSKQSARELAVAAGAIPESIEIIDIEDTPLAYHPGNVSRVKVKAAGDLP
jgi:N-methylhydantoinase A/oxoprolinase/acetone carboxylase beta subunit